MNRDHNSIPGAISTTYLSHSETSEEARHEAQVKALCYLVRNGVDPEIADCLGIKKLGRWNYRDPNAMARLGSHAA